MSVKLEAGQWYRTLANQIVKCIHVHPNRGYLLVFKDGSCGYYPPDQAKEHLTDCTGFDWEPPKPIEPPQGWRLLTEGETILVTDQWWEGKEWRRLPDDTLHAGKSWNEKQYHPMARKIEPKYRPFTNDQEAFPHCDEWLVNESNHKLRVDKVNKSGIATYDGYFDFLYAFFKYKKLDGTPFGVRVDE